MNKTLIFGHKNPDTDSICSALAAGFIFKDEYDVEVCRLGSISDETKYILDYINMNESDYPKLLEKVDGEQVIMVDHNEFPQSVDGIETATILKVVDHHRISNFNTSAPLYMNIQPVGCTATILTEIAQQKKLDLPKDIATLLLSAIISDTLYFQSPTCTEKDVKTCKYLAQIADIDLDVYAIELLKAGTNLTKYSAEELLSIDAKSFSTSNGSFRVAQVTTLDIEETYSYFEKDIEEVMNKQIEDNNFDLMILLITDILNCNSKAIVYGSKLAFFEKQFNVNLLNNTAILENVVSRKKQVVPFL